MKKQSILFLSLLIGGLIVYSSKQIAQTKHTYSMADSVFLDQLAAVK